MNKPDFIDKYERHKAAMFAFVEALEELAERARQKGDTSPDQFRVAYAYGVQFGFETAAKDLRELLESDQLSRE